MIRVKSTTVRGNGHYQRVRKLKTGVASFVVATLSVVGAQMFLSDAASASTTNDTVMVNTQRMSAATLTSTQAGWYSKGSHLNLVCYSPGQSVKGFYSPYISGGWDNLWYQVSDGYWVADVDINTGFNYPVTPRCSTQPVTATPQVAASLNAAIMARANATPTGTSGGQCAIWVENIISAAGGPQVRLGSYGSGYQAAWSRFATRVTSWSQVFPGDVVQFYNPSSGAVHTVIITSGTSAASASVVDSNYTYTPTVKRGSFASRDGAFGANYMIWRVHQ